MSTTHGITPASFREARKKAGLTQAQVAARAGVSTATVVNLEKCVTKPHPDTMARLHAALNGTPSASKPPRNPASSRI